MKKKSNGKIENISSSILENKNQTIFPGFTIEDTLLNTKILENWSNAQAKNYRLYNFF